MFKRWRRNNRFPALPEEVWQGALSGLPLFGHLQHAAIARLRVQVEQLLAEKDFIGKQGLELDDSMLALIGVQMCLPVLNLGVDCYRDWRTVIVYPDTFVAPRELHDAAGVVHSFDQPLAGEAWDGGPIVLSWGDVLSRGDGFNLVIHECAHKLDLLNGDDNGFPPLHPGMDGDWWARVFSAAYEQLCRQVDADQTPPLDAYAATSPGEFFAVVSEAFFEIPAALKGIYPQVYRQLALFYRQDPVGGGASCSLTAPD